MVHHLLHVQIYVLSEHYNLGMNHPGELHYIAEIMSILELSFLPEKIVPQMSCQHQS